ncbi:MAG: FKBP-type peptidyl-prolyl cis-trans isomerase [Chitinophagaceae bacterium]
MKKLIFVSVLTIVALGKTFAQTKTAAKPASKPAAKPAAAAPKTTLKNLIDSASYAIGLSEARFMKQQGLTKINSAVVAKAIDDVMNNRTVALDDQQANSAIMSCITQVQQEKSKGTIEEGQKFLVENKKRPEVKTTPSGLQYEVLQEGTGIKPTTVDTFVAHYRGSLTNGTVFEESYTRNEPITYPLNRVIAGWTEGLQLMTVGSKYKFYIPYNLAYGLQGSPPTIPGGATLIFEIELLDVKKKM